MMLACLASCSESKDEPVSLPYMDIEQIHYNVSAEAQTIDVSVRTNIDLVPKVIQNDDSHMWISITNSPTHTGDKLTYKVMISSNPESVQRNGYVYFEPAPGISIPKDAEMGNNSIIIVQSAANP